MGCNSSQDAKKVEEAVTNGKKECANTQNHVPDSPEKIQDISEDITPAKSEGTVALEEGEFGEEEEKAATKIQAVFRGHQVRKKFVPVDEAAIDAEIAHKPIVGVTTIKGVDHKIDQAKEAIKEEVKMSGGKVEHEPSKAELEAEFNPEDKELCNAATKIQASFRGHQVRKQTEKTEKAEEAVKARVLTPYKHHFVENSSEMLPDNYPALPALFNAYDLDEEGRVRGPRPYDEEETQIPITKPSKVDQDLEDMMAYLRLIKVYISKLYPLLDMINDDNDQHDPIYSKPSVKFEVKSVIDEKIIPALQDYYNKFIESLKTSTKELISKLDKQVHKLLD